jgi:hypothetical protein
MIVLTYCLRNLQSDLDIPIFDIPIYIKIDITIKFTFPIYERTWEFDCARILGTTTS